MAVGPRPVPATATFTAVASAVVSTTARTRVSYCSFTNNDASPRYLVFWDAATLVLTNQPKYIAGPVAASATYVCTNVDLKPAGLVFENGVVVATATTYPTQIPLSAGPANVPQVVLGTSGTFVVWTEIEP